MKNNQSNNKKTHQFLVDVNPIVEYAIKGVNSKADQWLEKDPTNIFFLNYWCEQLSKGQLMLIYNKNVPYSLCTGYWQLKVADVSDWEIPNLNKLSIANKVRKYFEKLHQETFGEFISFSTAIQESITLYSPWAVFVQTSSSYNGVVCSTSKDFVEKVRAFIEDVIDNDKSDNKEERTITRLTVAQDGTISPTNAVINFANSPRAKKTHYPWIKQTGFEDIESLIQYFLFETPEPVLYFYGPPGTGKSTFAREIALTTEGMVVTVEDQNIYNNPGFVGAIQSLTRNVSLKQEENAVDLNNKIAELKELDEDDPDVRKLKKDIERLKKQQNGSPVLLIMDDAEIAIQPRTNNGAIAGSLLGASDGVVSASDSNLKIIIITNLENIPAQGEVSTTIDVGLLRPGRCAGTVNFKLIDYKNTVEILLSHDKLPPTEAKYNQQKGRRSGIPLSEVFGLSGDKKRIEVK